MVWPTLGSRTAKEQNRTHQIANSFPIWYQRKARVRLASSARDRRTDGHKAANNASHQYVIIVPAAVANISSSP